MKAILINPISDLVRESNTYIHSVTPLPPLGLAYLAGILKQNNIEVTVEDQYASRISDTLLLDKIRDISPDIIGFSCLTTAMSAVRRMAEKIKSAHINTKIILGNIHPTLFPDELLRKGLADVVVRGEGEKALLETAVALDKKTGLENIKGISYFDAGKIRHNPEAELIEDLDALPYPDWHKLNLHHYKRYPMLGIYNKLVLPVQASRGCPYNCLFCSQDKFYKRPRYRRIKNVVDEIEYLHGEFKIDYIGFTDAYFPFSKSSGLEFCDELIRRRLHRKIKWFTETRVDMVDPELMRRMKESGLYLVMYGFEVGNQKVLEATGKGTTLEQARKAMECTRKEGVRSMGLFMLGLPVDTKETCEQTIGFAKEINPDIVKFNIAVPFPGSRFFRESQENIGDIESLDNKFTSWYDWSSYDGNIIYSPEKLSKRELINLQRKGMFSFYMRPKIILAHLMNRTFTLSDLCFGGMVLLKNYFKMSLEHKAVD